MYRLKLRFIKSLAYQSVSYFLFDEDTSKTRNLKLEILRDYFTAPDNFPYDKK